MRVLAIDPGRNHTGWAWFCDSVMYGCGVSVLPPEGKIWPLGKVLQFHGQVGIPDTDLVVCEQMGLTVARENKLSAAIGKGNILLELQAVAAYIAGRCYSAQVQYVRHFQCTKTVTKNRCMHLLTEGEKKTMAEYKGTKKDDMFDAIAHGLRAVGRM